MKQEKSLVLGKKIECIIGVIFLIPPIIAVFCFLFSWFDWAYGSFAEMRKLGGVWDYQDGAASPTPIYLGLMAISGAYLVKDSFKYLLLKEDKVEKIEEP